MNNKIGLTGASGSLGRILKKLIGKNLFIDFKDDISNRQKVFDWVKSNKFDTIIHLAAIVPIKKVNRNKIYAKKINFFGTKNLVDATLLKKNVKWFFLHQLPMCTDHQRKKFLKIIKQILFHIMAKQNLLQKSTYLKNSKIQKQNIALEEFLVQLTKVKKKITWFQI